MRARRPAWWIALISMPAAALLVAAPLPAAEPAPEPEPASPAEPAELDPKAAPPARRYRPFVDRGNAIPAPYAMGTLTLGSNVHMGAPTQAEVGLGFAVGLTPRVWLDGSLGTLRWAPALVFHSATIGPNVLVVDTPAFELDAMVHLSGPSDDGRPVEQIEPAFYTVAHVDHALRVDTEVAFDVNPGPTTTYGFKVPTALSFQLTEHVYASINTGVTLGSFADARESAAIPAGISLGWSDYLTPTGPQVIAISPAILWPQLLRPWAGEPFRPGVFAVGITFYYAWKY